MAPMVGGISSRGGDGAPLKRGSMDMVGSPMTGWGASNNR